MCDQKETVKEAVERKLVEAVDLPMNPRELVEFRERMSTIQQLAKGE